MPYLSFIFTFPTQSCAGLFYLFYCSNYIKRFFLLASSSNLQVFVIDGALYLKLRLLNSVIRLPVLELNNSVPLACFIPDNWTGALELHFPMKTFRDEPEFAITHIFLVQSSCCI